jgi:hypothetical protein
MEGLRGKAANIDEELLLSPAVRRGDFQASIVLQNEQALSFGERILIQSGNFCHNPSLLPCYF